MEIAKQKQAVALLSVLSNTLLVLLKLVIGTLTGSVSILSEGIHSGIDLLASGLALFAVRASSRPPDEAHPYGHGKFENVSGALEALLIFGAAIWIIVESAEKLLHPQPVEMLGWGVAVMGVSVLCNLFVSHLLFTVGKRADSVALLADAWHLKTDVYTSLGVMIALGLMVMGGVLWPGTDLTWVDPVGAILVAMLILRAAFHLTKQSVRDLIDTRLPPDDEAQIIATIHSFAPVARGFHRLRTRKSGAERFAEFHLFVDGQMTVKESHSLAHQVSDAIKAKLPGCAVVIHIEPCDLHCAANCKEGCFLLGE